MKNNTLSLILFFVLLLFWGVSPIFAATGDILFEDDFRTRNKADLNQTSAVIDTAKGEVRLPQITGSQSFDVFEDAMIVQNGNIIELYERDNNGFFQKITHYSDEEVVALSFSSQGYAHYVLGKNGDIYKMEYGAGEYIQNPAYKLMGLKSAVSIAANDDKVFVGEINQLVRYGEGDATLDFVEQIDLDFNLSQVSVGAQQEIVVSGEDAVHVFRMAGTGYVESPLERLTGTGYAVIPDEEEKAVIIEDNTVQYFRHTGEVLNINHAGVQAIRAMPGLIYVRDYDSITEYAFDGSRMVPVNRLIGLSPIEKYYLSPRQYQSKLFSFDDPGRRFRVLSTTETPGTSFISFYVSTNGINFVPVINGSAQLENETTQLIVRAVLNHGGSEELTPRLLDLKVVDARLSIDKLETTEIIRDPGGNPPLPTEAPVQITGGYNFHIRVTAPGANKVWIQFSNGENRSLNEQSPSVFTGAHYFPHDIELGSIISATVFAQDEEGNQVNREFNNHYYVASNIEEKLNVFDTR